MNIKFIINKALSIPPHIFIRKVYFVLIRKIKHLVKKRKDFIFSTYSQVSTNKILNKYIVVKDIKLIKNENIDFISSMYLTHKFDLLGSGWVENSYDSIAYGLEKYKYAHNKKFIIEDIINSTNIKISKDIYSYVDKDYIPIDWQKDFKSGFRWSAKDWYLNQRNSLVGVDIKVPWEIGRLQHLPQLAIFAIGSDEKEKYIKEFRNQMLDFIALNPPRFGVQWTCTMDVGIRVANMLLAYDMFIQIDNSNILDNKFKEIFTKNIYEHGIHIINNLEYGENLTSNHYLSDIVGLLFVSSYLESYDEINQWLAFSIQEVVSEMQKQFYEDGGNFEASTSYHRLSSELMIYATALIIGLPKNKVKTLKDYSMSNWKVQPKLKDSNYQEYKIENDKIVLPDWYIFRLYKAGQFTYDISKENGEISQFGDNDSGRFFRLSPNGELLTLSQSKEKYKSLDYYESDEELFWDENILNHQTLLASFGGLFEYDIFNTSFCCEKNMIKSLSKNRTLKVDDERKELIKDNITFDNFKYTSEKVFDMPLKDGKSILDDLNFIAYKQSGIYIFKSPRLYFVISAGSNGQKGNGGHAHNDKLSFELSIDGKDIIVDAGTYLYTPLQDERNKFRSTASHNTLIVKDEEQNEWMSGRYGLFSMKNQSKCYLLDFGEDFLDVAVEYRGIKQRRKFMIKEDKIVIENYSNKEFEENYNDFKLYSNGYGKLVNEK
ncbi:alginate lyase family protein [bacterium]|jgi:hypothetical protein|nr:alginate lyase family protein [bacterium]